MFTASGALFFLIVLVGVVAALGTLGCIVCRGALHARRERKEAPKASEGPASRTPTAALGDMGDFSPSDIRGPYSKIIGENVGIDRFNPQLTSLATNRDILIREGEERRWRYRFKDPLMEPYVLLEGLNAGTIGPEDFPH